MAGAKREADLKGQLVKRYRERLTNFTLYRHEDLFLSGIPDITSTGLGSTIWLECKHATPYIEKNVKQELECGRLARRGFCRYIVWWNDGDYDGKRTLIVHPKKMKERSGPIIEAEDACRGFDMDWVVEQIYQMHVRLKR